LSENIIRNNSIVRASMVTPSLLLRYSLPQIKAARENVNSNEELEPSLVSRLSNEVVGDGAIKNTTVRENRCPLPAIDFTVDDRFWRTFLFTTSLNGALRTFD